MTQKPLFIGYIHSAKYKLTSANKLVDIISVSYPHPVTLVKTVNLVADLVSVYRKAASDLSGKVESPADYTHS